MENLLVFDWCFGLGMGLPGARSQNVGGASQRVLGLRFRAFRV